MQRCEIRYDCMMTAVLTSTTGPHSALRGNRRRCAVQGRPGKARTHDATSSIHSLPASHPCCIHTATPRGRSPAIRGKGPAALGIRRQPLPIESGHSHRPRGDGLAYPVADYRVGSDHPPPGLHWRADRQPGRFDHRRADLCPPGRAGPARGGQTLADFIGAGIGGDTSGGMLKRLDRDVFVYLARRWSC